MKPNFIVAIDCPPSSDVDAWVVKTYASTAIAHDALGTHLLTWAFGASFDIILYDLTSTYFEPGSCNRS